MARSPYVLEYEGRFDLPAPPGDVWAAIRQMDSFETWWGWLRDLRVEGAPLESGCVLHGVVAPPVPYRMRLQVALVRCVAPTHIDAEVSGDLVGGARIQLDPAAGGTRATVGWTVEMMPRPMRIAARVGSPLIRWGHDRVVDLTVAHFRRELVSRELSRSSQDLPPSSQDLPRPNGQAAEGGSWVGARRVRPRSPE